MIPIVAKIDNTSVLPAAEFNPNLISELANAVINSGQTLDGTAANLNQLSEAMGRYGGGGGDFYLDSGVADAYVLTSTAPFKTSKVYFNGMRIVFVAGNANTGASVINVSIIGSADLKDSTGLPLTPGYITAGETYTAVFISGEFRIVSIGGGAVRGMISLWFGAIIDIPSGWTLCDGNLGTPDLTDLFPRGAGGSFTVNQTGGSETTGGHPLTAAENGPHTHPAISSAAENAESGTGVDVGNGIATTTGSSGSGTAHTHPGNVPPFRALAYIMKL